MPKKTKFQVMSQMLQNYLLGTWCVKQPLITSGTGSRSFLSWSQGAADTKHHIPSSPVMQDLANSFAVGKTVVQARMSNLTASVWYPNVLWNRWKQRPKESSNISYPTNRLTSTLLSWTSMLVLGCIRQEWRVPSDAFISRYSCIYIYDTFISYLFMYAYIYNACV